MMYMANDDDADAIYVFASKAGAPTNPDWYYNLVPAGEGARALRERRASSPLGGGLGRQRARIARPQLHPFLELASGSVSVQVLDARSRE